MQSSIDAITSALESSSVTPSGVSFAGKSLKLDTAQDAEIVIKAIDECKNLYFLNLEGNTLGVEASEAIAQALEKHPEFKRAQWKDMFTGRMKTEIPKALKYLGDGLVKANAHLIELDMSDNAFGPIGVEGLASFLRSSSCYCLEELRLNNNGLGITGGKLLASALTDCYHSSKKYGKAFSLRVFIAGRNRLENEGATALASVFKLIGTLEEIAMPQNGIYHKGISALCEAFDANRNLQILNLNDNTIGVNGAKAIAEVLPNLQNLKEINFGDCLLKSNGATALANALQIQHNALQSLSLDHNEIGQEAALQLVNCLKNKNSIIHLHLDGNQFGNVGRTEIENQLKQMGKINILSSLSEDESADSVEEGSDEEEHESDEHDSYSDEEQQPKKQCTVSQFEQFPTAENFLLLGDSRDKLIVKEIQETGGIQIERFIPLLMKVVALTANLKPLIQQSAEHCGTVMCKELFSWSRQKNNISIVNNELLVNLGLIKCEDKSFKPTWNLDGCLSFFSKISDESFVPESTSNTLKCFLERNQHQT